MLQYAEYRSLYLCLVICIYAMYTGAEVLDAAKEKDGILSLQLLESKVDHSVRCDCVSHNECLKFTLFTKAVV